MTLDRRPLEKAAMSAEAVLTAGEAELRRSDALMRTFIGSLPGAVYRFAFDHRWKLDFVSPAIEALSGQPAGIRYSLGRVTPTWRAAAATLPPNCSISRPRSSLSRMAGS